MGSSRLEQERARKRNQVINRMAVLLYSENMALKHYIASHMGGLLDSKKTAAATQTLAGGSKIDESSAGEQKNTE